MTTYVQSPYLPQQFTKTALVSSQAISVISDLKALGIEAFPIPACEYLQKEIATHVDMLCCPLGGNSILIHNYDATLTDYLIQLGFCVTLTEVLPQKEYPLDISLNAVILNGRLICLPTYTAHELLQSFSQNNILVVKQGYTKCNTLMLSSNSLITSDKSIAQVARQSGFDILEITPGFIALEGFPYGFIGGCGAMLDSSTLYLSGKLSSHPDHSNILAFLHQKQISLIEGSSNILLDVGSILPLTC